MAAITAPNKTVENFVTQIKEELAPKLDVKIGRIVGDFTADDDIFYRRNVIGEVIYIKYFQTISI
jgi:hypothetical protein